MPCIPERIHEYDGSGNVICINFDGKLQRGYIDSGRNIKKFEMIENWAEFGVKWAEEHSDPYMATNIKHMFDQEYICMAIEQLPGLIERLFAFMESQPVDGKPLVFPEPEAEKLAKKG